MEPKSTDSRMIRSRSQQIRACVQVWAKCLASAQTIEEILAAEPATSKARLNLREAIENALKEDWSSAAAAGIQTPNGTKARMCTASTDGDGNRMESSTAASASIRNTHLVEDVLWKEVFYKPLTMAKRLKRPNCWNTDEMAVVRTFLEDGMDYYLSLLKLFSWLHSSTSGCSSTRTSVVVRCLCCLGDLSRYYCTDLSPKLSLLPVTARYMVPSQYYNQVLELSPGAALAHSNLASVLRSIHNAPLQAAVHYLAALRCSRFEGARVQLMQLLDHSISKYEAYYEHNQSYSQFKPSALEGHFLHTVLATVSCFAGGDDENSHVEVCQDFLVQLGKLLQTSADYSSASSDLQQTPRGGDGVKGREGREAVLLAAALLVAAHKRQTPPQGSTCAVLLASVLLTVVCQCLSALQHTITSLHSDDVLLALTLATTPRLPPQAATGTSARNSSGERNEPADCRSQTDKEEEVKNMVDTAGQKKRPAPRRRRLRRRPQATKGDWNSSGGNSDDDSSSGQEHFSSDHSGWSSDDSREGSDADSCTSEYDSDEDVIIESEDEVVEQASILAIKGDQKSVTSSSIITPTPASRSSAAVAPAPNARTNEPLAAVHLDPKPNSAFSPPIISALEHLKLVTISDGSGGEKPQQQQPSSPSFRRHEQLKSLPASVIPTMKAVSVGSSDAVAACVGRAPPSSLLAAVCVLTAWLRSESVAKGTIVWCDAKSNNNEDVGDDREANPSAGQVESSRVLWKALVAYCNLIFVDLRQLSSTVNVDQLLPNLENFFMQCQQTHLTSGAKIFNNSMLHHDCFVLPEDDFLKSTIPSVVPQHVLQLPPGVQCPHVAPYLHHVGVTKANVLKPISKTSPTISDEMNKLWLSEPCHNGVVSSKTPISGSGGSLINAFEESLIRSLRVRNDLRLLSKFQECPVQFCEETGLFSVQPRAGCAQSSASSSTAGSGSNSNNCKPYYLKKVSFGGYVMDKLVRHRTRPRTEERRAANSGRERGRKPSFRERGRPSKNRHMPNGGGRRNLYPDGGPEFSRKTGNGRRRRDFTSEELRRAGGRLRPGRQNRRRDDKSLNYTQPTQADDSVDSSVRLPDKQSREAAKFDGHNSACSGGSVVSESASLGNNADDSNEIFGLEDLKDAPLISPDTTSPTNGKFGAIGDRRKAATAIAADGSNVGGCAALSTIATPSGETFGEGTSDDNEAAKKFRRDHGQRMLTARWLRHKLDTTDSKPMMYLVPDASAIVYHLDTIKSIVQQRQTVVVVPMQVLSDIDEAKRNESAARDASRWLDRVLLGRGDRVCRNATLRLQGTAERAAMPGVQCPPKHHKTAWRWFQILECCHHLSRLEYFPKIGASEEAPTTKAVGRGVGSLYSDKQQQPAVLKNKHKSSLSQHSSPAAVPGNGLSLVPKAEDDNLMDRTAVVTLLTAETGDTISKLPFQLGLLASRVAAKLVFVSDYKKTQTLSHGQT